METIAKYLDYVKEHLVELSKAQAEPLERAAKLAAQSYCDGKQFFTFGTGHSHLIAEEIYVRVGGLAFVKGILPGELMMHEKLNKSTLLERLEGYAEILLTIYGVGSGDTVLIISNSGRNSVPVEMALGAKARGASVIAITSLTHSQRVSSRNKSGKRLFEVADVVIDNGSAYGDAEFIVPGCSTPTGPISDIMGTAMAQALVVGIVEQLAARGIDAPIFRSSNSDGADEHNEKLFAQYFNV